MRNAESCTFAKAYSHAALADAVILMDNRSWFYEEQRQKKSSASPAAHFVQNHEINRNRLSSTDCEEEQFQGLDAILQRGERLDTLVLKTEGLQEQAKYFYRKGGKKMGFTFRDHRNEKTVFIGKRTVKDGECCGIWDMSGNYRACEGPKRQWLMFSRVRFMDRHVADSHQYLEVRYRNGKKEHKRGPLAMFEDPVAHESISVMNAVTVDAFEVIVVYTEDAQGNVKRNMVHGPTVFIPDVNQWLHVFRWHGSKKGGDEHDKVPGALVFTKLRTIPDQFYYNAQGVRTSDDASLTVKVMIFFQMDNLELMLNSTHDPIGDFINALLADLMNFSSRHSYEQFIQCAQQLSELETFPVLCSRAAAVGFKIGKVVYRGYQANAQLQSLCDAAIKTRTELKLKQEGQEQRERMLSMELKGNNSRGVAERSEEVAKQEHRLQLEAAVHREAIKRQQQEHAERLRQAQETARMELAAKTAADEAHMAYLAGLGKLGVDLTQYLVACAEKQPDKVLKVLSNPGPAAGGLNIHTNV